MKQTNKSKGKDVVAATTRPPTCSSAEASLTALIGVVDAAVPTAIAFLFVAFHSSEPHAAPRMHHKPGGEVIL